MVKYLIRLFWLPALFPLASLTSLSGTEKTTMEEFMGINGHTVQFKPELYHPVARQVRDYHPVEWDLGKDSASTPPFPFAANRVSWKHVYGSWLKQDWNISACLMFESIPRNGWKDLSKDAKAYGKAFASAFGPGGQFPCVTTAEIGNEPGKFSDEDYRLVFENMAKGLREGDPKLRISTCNVTVGKSHDYAKSVGCLQGLDSLYDVLSIHVYAQLEPWPTWIRSNPEDPKLPNYINEVKELCRWRDEHVPDKAVWITEFGYDASTKKPEPVGDFAKWVGNSEEEQALWNVRSWLLFSALPVERAYVYFFNDGDTPQLHGSSGLTRNFVPKPSYWAAAHLQKALGKFRFSKVVEEKNGESMIYEYRKDQDIVWVAWVPTREGKVALIQLPELPGNVLRAERLSQNEGAAQPVEISGRTMEISGAPVFIFFSKF
jgi:hypothetical protein